jgi:putative peptidoglycan lipid II flippase
VLNAVLHTVFGLALAAAIGMTTTGLLLVAAVRRNAGPAALAGLGRVLGVGIVAAGVAALAGWEIVRALGPAGALIQAAAGAITLLVVFAAVAYALDRRDLQPIVRRLRGGDRK